MGHGGLWHRDFVILDIRRDASLWLRQPLAPMGGNTPMTSPEKIRAILTDSHFLIPLIVFGIGLALLITLH
jgi:hypothetical protein